MGLFSSYILPRIPEVSEDMMLLFLYLVLYPNRGTSAEYPLLCHKCSWKSLQRRRRLLQITIWEKNKIYKNSRESNHTKITFIGNLVAYYCWCTRWVYVVAVSTNVSDHNVAQKRRQRANEELPNEHKYLADSFEKK